MISKEIHGDQAFNDALLLALRNARISYQDWLNAREINGDSHKVKDSPDLPRIRHRLQRRY